jgi:uncharacterized protein YktA (UPF0223 family)
MKKITLVAGLALILVVPAVSVAKPTPDRADKRAAKSECNMFRGHSGITREAFLTKYKSFKACVKARARDEAQEEQSARRNAAQECREERGNTPESRQAFAEQYGKNGNQKNAFGKCVSSKAKAKKHEADAADQQEATAFKNAAKECDAERGDTDESRQAFALKYGTAKSHYKNAFGKCVSQKAHEHHDYEFPPAS